MDIGYDTWYGFSAPKPTASIVGYGSCGLPCERQQPVAGCTGGNGKAWGYTSTLGTAAKYASDDFFLQVYPQMVIAETNKALRAAFEEAPAQIL